MTKRVSSDNSQTLGFELRKVQQHDNTGSFSVSIPSNFSKRMKIVRGDILRMTLKDNRLLISERLNLEGVSGNAAIDVDDVVNYVNDFEITSMKNKVTRRRTREVGKYKDTITGTRTRVFSCQRRDR